MSRDIKSDFENLLNFIKAYNLENLTIDKNFINAVTQQHKKYYAYLVYIAEIQDYVEKSEFSNIFKKEQFLYIKESCSDIGSSFFSTFHGSYKSSKLLLRSSIETFFKGFCKDELVNIDKETSMYCMFDNIKKIDFFSKNPQMLELFNKIHQEYKSLCGDVHTATVRNMANISALNYFPTFNKSESETVCNYTLKLIPCYLTLLLQKYNEQFHKFHYNNKEIIMESIQRKYRPLINNIE
ncbi:hypothetical protein CTM53_08880 [Prevotella intermedia]|uniref:Uncharacterized protein n=1 Tax=Prevotella intermedia TaxID=28131 RepID=A0AAJ3RN26_PREIN|nr:hypothetical protein [Prevotella intermedia]PJI18742.1 hypothetical protein CTM53_08880 [Prevotella intermedia]